jgi:HlyD family secretion protein
MSGARAPEFMPMLLAVQREAPPPMPRFVLITLASLFVITLAWAAIGRLDVVAVAHGKIVPQGFLKIVQPAEPGIVRELLVKDGDVVEAGQVLVRMDRRLQDADSRAVEHELKLRELQLRRIDAELTGAPMRPLTGDPPELLAKVQALHHARRQSYLDAIGAEDAILAKARHDLQVATEVENKLGRTLPIYREQAQGWEQLAKEGFAGRLMALERQRNYIEVQQDLRAQAHAIEGLKAAIAQSEQRLAQITSNYRQQLSHDRVEAEAQRHRLQQDLDKLQHRSGLLELRAPQGGVVKDLATHTPGTVVTAGTILLTLVPRDEPLVAEVWVSNADVGFVQPAQKSRIKLAAYPFQKYGMVEGRVQRVSADAQDNAGDSTGKTSPPEAAYRTLIELESGLIDGRGAPLALVPGMLVSAEIHLGTRTVLEYLLSPVRKVLHEAGRER